MATVGMRVGALARRTGVSVRTLHYYDEIGLLRPSGRTEAGYRVYGADDIVRLQQIRALQQLGLSLEQVRTCLDGAGFAPRQVIALQLAALRRQLALLEGLCQRLERLADWSATADDASAEEFLQIIEEMNRMEKYYTPEQLAELKVRAEQVGSERIRQVEAEWPALMAEVQAAMEAGLDPASPTVQALARRWSGLVREFTGGNPAIERSLRSLYEQEEVVHGMHTGPMRAMAAYIGQALAADRPAGDQASH